MTALLRSLWNYRFFVASSVVVDLRARFVRSRLGALWLVLQPLAQAAIFALILSSVLSARLPGIEGRFAYPTYLLSGMLAWSLFSEVVTRCLSLFVEHAGLLKKLAFPRICLPAVVASSALVNNLLLLAATLAVLAMMGHDWSVWLVWLPVLMLLTLALGLGLGLLLGVINVFVRDTAQVMTVFLQLWFWFTPIVYVRTIIPEGFGAMLAWNPMVPIVESYQRVIAFGKPPEAGALLGVAALAAALLAVALVLFRRASPEMADVL